MPDTQEKKKQNIGSSELLFQQGLLDMLNSRGDYVPPMDMAATISSLPPLDPASQAKETPLGPMRPEELAQPDTAAAVGAKMLENTQKEEDGGAMPFGQRFTGSVGERVAQELQAFEQARDRNFLEDNWGKILTMLAGTALQMVGAHNKNPSIFIGGNFLSQVGGAQLGDYFRTKGQEQQAIVGKLMQEPATSRDVQAAMEMLRQKAAETGKSVDPAYIEQVLDSFPNFSEEQRNLVRQGAKDIGPGEGAKLSLERTHDAAVGALHEYMASNGIVDIPTDSQKKVMRAYLRDKAASVPPEDPLYLLNSNEGARMLETIVSDAVSQPVSSSLIESEDIQDEQKDMMFTDASAFWMKELGYPASRGMMGEAVQVNRDEALRNRVVNKMMPFFGKEFPFVGTEEKVQKMGLGEFIRRWHEGIAKEWEEQNDALVMPTMATHQERTEGKRKFVPIFKDPIPPGVDRDEWGKRMLDQAIKNPSLFNPDFIDFYRRIFREVLVR